MNSNCIKPLLAALSCLGMLFSSIATAATPLATPSDVALGNGGVLIGQVVDAQGNVSAMATVILSDYRQEIARVRTDQEGKFSVSGLRGGVYRISSQDKEALYRLWAPNTAPPVAQQGVTLVVGNQVVCGQNGNSSGSIGSMAQWIAEHPLIAASAVGAAIAIPIALDDDDWTPPSSP